MVLFFTVTLPSALSLYWLTGGLVALWQQSRILGQDEDELETEEKKIIEGEIVEKPKPKAKKTNKQKQPAKKSSTKSKKKRKK